MLATAVALAATGDISTVAGDGAAGFLGDGGPAISARLDRPMGVALDTSGDLYIADRVNNRIRKVDTSGDISTVAGTGVAGFSGDGGPAVNAKLFSPFDVEVDSAGNIYIADVNNNRIRKVDTSGNISTVAGNEGFGFAGDGGPATSANLQTPEGVTVDSSGNLFIADSANNRVRKVDTSGDISTVAGDGTAAFGGDGGEAASAQLNFPTGVAVDSSGNLFIADRSNSRVRKVDTSGDISTVAGDGTTGSAGDGGAATLAQVWFPFGVSVDTSGSVFASATGDHRVRKVDGSTQIITTVAGDGTAGPGGDGGPAVSAQLNFPAYLVIDSSGNLLIADFFNHRVRKMEAVAATTPTPRPFPAWAHGVSSAWRCSWRGPRS